MAVKHRLSLCCCVIDQYDKCSMHSFNKSAFIVSAFDKSKPQRIELCYHCCYETLSVRQYLRHMVVVYDFLGVKLLPLGGDVNIKISITNIFSCKYFTHVRV